MQPSAHHTICNILYHPKKYISWSPFKFNAICQNCHRLSLMPYVKIVTIQVLYHMQQFFTNAHVLYLTYVGKSDSFIRYVALFRHPSSFIPYVTLVDHSPSFLPYVIKDCKPWWNSKPIATFFIYFWFLYHLQHFYVTLQVLHHIYNFLVILYLLSAITYYLLSTIIYYLSTIISYLLQEFSKIL